MGKHNQVTENLRVNAELHLKNSRNFIKDMEKVIDGLDINNKLYSQLSKATEQLKNYNKVLEKVDDKNLVGDEELKNINKIGKEITNLIVKTENFYKSFSSQEIKKFSKDYIQQVKEQEKAVAKIKEDYARKTGGNLDKDISNLEMYEEKIRNLNKTIKNLNSSKDNKIEKAINAENEKLQQQFELLKKIEKTENEIKQRKKQTINEYSQKTGFSAEELQSKVKNDKKTVTKDVANQKYQEMLNTYNEISKKYEGIINSGKTEKATQKELIALAKNYNLENIKTTEEFKSRLGLMNKEKNYYRSLNNREQLATEKEINAEIKRRQELITTIDKMNLQVTTNTKEILSKNNFDSEQDLKTKRKNATNILNNSNVLVTATGASLNQQGEDSIASEITNATKEQTQQLANELSSIYKVVEQIKEFSGKLATQSERVADEQDVVKSSDNIVKKTVNATNNDGQTTRKAVEQTKNELSQNILRENAWSVGEQIHKVLGNAYEIENMSGLLTGTKADVGPIQELEKEYSFLIKELSRKGDYLKSELTPKEYEIITGEAQQLFEDAKTAINKISNAIKTKLDEEVKFREQEQRDMIEHNNKGQPRMRNGNFVFKEGYSQDDYNKVNLEIEKSLATFQLLDRIQSETNIDYTDGQNHLRKYNKMFSDYNRQVEKNTETLISHGDAITESGRGLEKATQQAQYLGNAFDEFKNKIGYFLSLNYVFDVMTQKIREAIQTTREMDKDMTQIGLVLEKSGKQVWKNFDSYSQMAERLNTTTSEVTQSMKLFYQQGLNTSEVNKMVEASAIAAALGESTMAEASETLTSILNSYNLTATDAMNVTDKISQIAIISAADFGELSTAIEKVASSAASAGLDLDHMMGYLAKMIETTREAPTNIGTALKTIVANFTQFKEDPTGLSEEGTEINKVDKALKSVGISLTDTNGEVRDLSEVLDELGQIWENLTRNQKSYLATAIAGTRQQSRFYALMNDYGRTLELVAEGSNSAGKAQQQFALYSNSLEASANRLTNQWEKFFNDITKGNGLVVHFTNGLTALMKVINAIGSIGTALGLGEGIKLARSIMFTFDNLKDTLKKRRGNNSDFINQKEEVLRSNLNDEEKSKKIDLAIEDYNRKQSDSLKDLNEAQLTYINSIEKINEQQKEFKNKIKTTPKVMQPFRKSLNNLKTEAQKTFASMKLGIQQVKEGLASMATHFAILGVITLALKLASAAFEGIKSALNVNAEAYIENAEKAQENAENIEGLVSEYKELSSKVNKTAEEQQRLKEITEEVTKIDAALGQELKNNVNNYEANIKAMEKYAKAQEKIAAQETVKALKSEGGIFRNLFNILSGDTWKGWFGSESEKSQLKTEQQNNWRALGSAKSVAADLSDVQTSMVNNYVEDLIRTQEEKQNWSDKSYKYNIGEFSGLVDEFIQSLQKMTKAQQDSYSTYLENLNSGKYTLGTMSADLWKLNLPDEVRSSLYNQLSAKEEEIKNRIDDNDFIKNKNAGYLAARNNMSLIGSSRLFNADTASFTTNEKSEYERIIAKILTETVQDKNGNSLILAEEYDKAVQQGSDGLTNFSKHMVKLGVLTDQQGQLLEVVNTQLASLEDLGDILEQFKSYTSEDWRNGSMSQLELIGQMIAGELNLSDIEISSYESVDYNGEKNIEYLLVPKINSLLTKIDKYISQLTQQYVNTENTLGILLQEALNDRKISTENVETIKANAGKLKTDLDTNRIITSDLQKVKATNGVNGWTLSNIPSFYLNKDPNAPPVSETPINYETAGITNSKPPIVIPKKEEKQNIDFSQKTIEFLQKRMGNTNIMGPQLSNSQEKYPYRQINSNLNIDKKQDFSAALKKANEELEKNKELVRTNTYTLFLKEGAESAEKYAKQFGDLGKEALEYAKTQESVINGLQENQKQAEKTREAIENVYKANIKPLEKFTAVFQQLEVSNAVAKNVKNYADAMTIANDATQNNHENVAELVTQYPSLIECVDATSDGWKFNSEKIKENAKTQVENEIESIDSKIRGTEAILSMLGAEEEGYQEWDTAVVSDIESAISYQDSLSENSGDTSQDVASALSNETENYADWGNKVVEAYRKVGEARNEYLRGLKSEEEYNYTVKATLGGVKLSGAKVESKEGTGEAKTAEQIAEEQKQKREELKKALTQNLSNADLDNLKEKYQRSLELLKSQRGNAQNRLNNIGGWLEDLGGDKNSGGGSKDAYEATIEKLERFYNYLRQIEALEAKINKIREKRNLINATQNYYIKDLAEENKLLKEQAGLYGKYINDQRSYLTELRSQISSAYGDWAYFNDEGVIQVKQTEFNINSEAEEERYSAFSELLQEYQEEYNTMLENQNTLYTIQSTIVENINTAYDKTLQKMTDVSERLEYLNSISEHWTNMEFGSIEKLKIMNNQIGTTADILLNAQKGVNELEGDFEQLSKTIKGSAFESLLTWDETLQKYFVNNDALGDEGIRKQFESQGYNWEEIVTWINTVAGASQKITDSLKNTNEQLMSAREQLKDLLEERISTIDEIFSKATEEINKFYSIYEQKIASLGTENDLFGVKSENLEQQYSYLTTMAQHAKSLLADLGENNKTILNTLMQDYGQYVQMIDGVAYINKMAIEESSTLSEQQKADLLQLYQLYYDSQEQIDEVNEKFYDYVNQIKELEETRRDAIIDLKQKVHDELIRLDQKEIDDLSEKYQKMNALDSEYYSKLQQRINDARNARSTLQEQQNLTQMQNRLSVLQQDNSGQYNAELVELQRQINEQLQQQADKNTDLEMERIAREQQERQKDREMQITQMENLLTFKDENGLYWQAAQDMIERNQNAIVGFLTSSKDFEDQSTDWQQKELESLTDLTKTASTEWRSQVGFVSDDIRKALEELVKSPLDGLPTQVQNGTKEITGQVQTATKTFIETMKGLFQYLDELTGKTAAKGYTTGVLRDNGVYTMPTKKPVNPPAPAAPVAQPQSQPSLTTGSHVQVKAGTRWYYDSYGTNPSGQARSGTIKYINSKGTHPYNIEGLGWIKKSDIVGYNKGGYVDYTGIAAVHGKINKPEAFLNAKQTALFETLRDALARVPIVNSKETKDNSENITIENFTIDVKELADTDSIDKVVKTVKDSIYRDATSTNNMKINRRR